MYEFLVKLLDDVGPLWIGTSIGEYKAHIVRNLHGDLIIMGKTGMEGARMLRPDGSISDVLDTSDPKCLEKARILS